MASCDPHADHLDERLSRCHLVAPPPLRMTQVIPQRSLDFCCTPRTNHDHFRFEHKRRRGPASPLRAIHPEIGRRPGRPSFGGCPPHLGESVESTPRSWIASQVEKPSLLSSREINRFRFEALLPLLRAPHRPRFSAIRRWRSSPLPAWGHLEPGHTSTIEAIFFRLGVSPTLTSGNSFSSNSHCCLRSSHLGNEGKLAMTNESEMRYGSGR